MQHLISQYGYLAVFVLMLAESACIPVPSELIMMFGGALAAGAVAGGHPALIGIVVAGVLGNVAGSYISWAIGRYAGQAAIKRWGRRIGIREHEIDRANAWFERHGPVAVLVGRIIPVIRTFISLPAGFAEMPAGKFGLYTTLGCIPWTAALGIAGYALGANWQSVANDFHGPTYIIAGVLVVAIVVLVIRRRRGRDAVSAADRDAQPGAAMASASARGQASGPYAPQDPWAQQDPRTQGQRTQQDPWAQEDPRAQGSQRTQQDPWAQEDPRGRGQRARQDAWAQDPRGQDPRGQQDPWGRPDAPNSRAQDPRGRDQRAQQDPRARQDQWEQDDPWQQPQSRQYR